MSQFLNFIRRGPFREIGQKSLGVVAAGVVFLVVLIIVFGVDMKQRAKLSRTMKQHDELVVVSDEYSRLSASVSRIEKRAALSKGESLPIVIENMFEDMGLKERLQSVKPFGGGTKEGYEMQEAEVVVERLGMNELVNVLYGIYTQPAGLFVTSAEFKRDFTERERINAKLSLKMISLVTEEGR